MNIDAGGIKIISENRKARFHYELLEKFEAGMVLTGAEIKAIRESGISLQESFIRPAQGELLLLNAHIKPYTHAAGDKEYNPTRTRKLLMHKKEILLLQGKVEQKGLTIIPIKVYLKKGKAKLELALARGKAGPDKRSDIKERETKRELARAMKVR